MINNFGNTNKLKVHLKCTLSTQRRDAARPGPLNAWNVTATKPKWTRGSMQSINVIRPSFFPPQGPSVSTFTNTVYKLFCKLQHQHTIITKSQQHLFHQWKRTDTFNQLNYRRQQRVEHSTEQRRWQQLFQINPLNDFFWAWDGENTNHERGDAKIIKCATTLCSVTDPWSHIIPFTQNNTPNNWHELTVQQL